MVWTLEQIVNAGLMQSTYWVSQILRTDPERIAFLQGRYPGLSEQVALQGLRRIAEAEISAMEWKDQPSSFNPFNVPYDPTRGGAAGFEFQTVVGVQVSRTDSSGNPVVVTEERYVPVFFPRIPTVQEVEDAAEELFRSRFVESDTVPHAVKDDILPGIRVWTFAIVRH